MNRIRLLPENVANQIAAGEVVERPASVVKELVENALDAQPSAITVEIQAGGRALIRVSDDGIGMTKDDALLCFERHATSKIRSAHDLASIATMGFRGEAMPSIASVCRLSLTTRERGSESPEGCQVVIHGGKIVEVKAAGASPGTIVEVRSLFYNIPARRKFLRSDDTEFAHIQHYLTLAALASPGIGWTVLHDGRLVWQLPAISLAILESDPLAALRERMRSLMGGELALLPVDYRTTFAAPVSRPDIEAVDTPEPGQPFRVWGWIGAPGVSRGTRDHQHLFVNRRPIDHRGLNHAMQEGYHTSLMKGRHPVACLFVELSPGEVDVNIHPSKREVKFRHERAVRQAVAEAIRQALLGFHRETQPTLPSVPVETESTPPANSTLGIDIPILPPVPAFTPVLRLQPETVAVPPSQTPPLFPWPKQSPATAPTAAAQASARPDSTLPPPSATAVPLLQVPLRLVGVVGRLYVVLESDRGMVLLDQHAAHERILFEQMLQRLEQGGVPSQRLLLAETVELSARDAEFLRHQLPNLVRMGIGLSEFGERTYLLDALPQFVRSKDSRQFVVGLIDALKIAGESVNSWRLGEDVIAKTVCRHAIKANDPLAGRELEQLIEDLRHCQMPYTCPHGRPTLIEMNYRELDKKFGRIQ